MPEEEKMLTKPTSVYVNWGAYDELADTVPLTEELALEQLDELLRLRAKGIQFDYYLMDAFWYAPDGGWRKWRQAQWPAGPDRWLEKCKSNDLKPGMWFSTNTLWQLNPDPCWEDSLNREGDFERSFMISAESGSGVDDLLDYLAQAMPEGPWHFPEDQVSDMPLRLLAAEITREQLYRQLHRELPYAAAVETEA